MADDCQNHMFTLISIFFRKQSMTVEIMTHHVEIKDHTGGVKLHNPEFNDPEKGVL